MKFTLLCLGVQLMVDETTKNCSDLLDMILECHGIYQDVIDIDNYPAVKHVSEYFVNERLENGWTVGKPEGHNEIFVVPSRGGKAVFHSSPSRMRMRL